MELLYNIASGMQVPQINRGYGAGGANTTASGRTLESMANLSTEYIVEDDSKTHETVRFTRTGMELCHTRQKSFEPYMVTLMNIDELYNYSTQIQAEGTIFPDDAYIDNKTKTLFWIEVKNQHTAGSVSEKIQSGLFKQQHLQERFPGYTVKYMYVLSSYFKRQPRCLPVFEKFKQKGIFYCFVDSAGRFKEHLENYMHEHVKQHEHHATTCRHHSATELDSTQQLSSVPRNLSVHHGVHTGDGRLLASNEVAIEWPCNTPRTSLSQFAELCPKHINNYREPFVGNGRTLLAILRLNALGLLQISGHIHVSDSSKELIGFYNNLKCHPLELHSTIQSLFDTHHTMPFDKPPNREVLRTCSSVQERKTCVEERQLCRAAHYYEQFETYQRANDPMCVQQSARLFFLCTLGTIQCTDVSNNSGDVIDAEYKWKPLTTAPCSEHFHELSQLFHNVRFDACDFAMVLECCQPNDLCYMDPSHMTFSRKNRHGVEFHKRLFNTALMVHNHMDAGLLLLRNANMDVIKNTFQPSFEVIDDKGTQKCIFLRNFKTAPTSE